jgi:hypothetical protein
MQIGSVFFAPQIGPKEGMLHPMSTRFVAIDPCTSMDLPLAETLLAAGEPRTDQHTTPTDVAGPARRGYILEIAVRLKIAIYSLWNVP